MVSINSFAPLPVTSTKFPCSSLTISDSSSILTATSPIIFSGSPTSLNRSLIFCFCSTVDVSWSSGAISPSITPSAGLATLPNSPASKASCSAFAAAIAAASSGSGFASSGVTRPSAAYSISSSRSTPYASAISFKSFLAFGTPTAPATAPTAMPPDKPPKNATTRRFEISSGDIFCPMAIMVLPSWAISSKPSYNACSNTVAGMFLSEPLFASSLIVFFAISSFSPLATFFDNPSVLNNGPIDACSIMAFVNPVYSPIFLASVRLFPLSIASSYAPEPSNPNIIVPETAMPAAGLLVRTVTPTPVPAATTAVGNVSPNNEPQNRGSTN